MPAMHDDWRIMVDFEKEDHGLHILRWLHENELAHDERKRLGDRVIISRSGAKAFLYAASETQAMEAERIALAEIERAGFGATTSMARWHPIEERWEDPNVPMPRTDAERLAAEGIPIVRRWKYVLVGAEDEDSAKALGERLSTEVPEAQLIRTEGSGDVAWENYPWRPFTVIRGLAGL